MGIVADLTPTQYSLIRISLQRSNGAVLVVGDMEIYNAAGQVIASHNASTTLTPSEEQMLATFVTRELAAFEAATGLTKCVGPKEPS